MTPGRMGLLFGLVAVGAILTGIATAFLVSRCCASGDDDGWLTYRNGFYGYEIRYPADWQIQIGERLEDPNHDFETQGVRISNGPELDGRGRVLAIVNFQGDWCTTSGKAASSAISVSGFRGLETRCFWPEYLPCSPEPTCREKPSELVRRFEDGPGGHDYYVLGDSGNDGETSDTMSRIVESFRFIQ